MHSPYSQNTKQANHSETLRSPHITAETHLPVRWHSLASKEYHLSVHQTLSLQEEPH